MISKTPYLGTCCGSAGLMPWRTCVDVACVWFIILTASDRSQCILVTLSPKPACSLTLHMCTQPSQVGSAELRMCKGLFLLFPQPPKILECLIPSLPLQPEG